LKATSNLGENFNNGAFETELKNLLLQGGKLQDEIIALHNDDIDSSKVAKAAEDDR
jgi:hypothetical protein